MKVAQGEDHGKKKEAFPPCDRSRFPQYVRRSPGQGVLYPSKERSAACGELLAVPGPIAAFKQKKLHILEGTGGKAGKDFPAEKPRSSCPDHGVEIFIVRRFADEFL